MVTFRDPRFVIAYTIILGFMAAYVQNPSDTMNGALIAAFAGAWGYFLGSSQGSSDKNSIIATHAATAKPTLDLTGAELPPAQGN